MSSKFIVEEVPGGSIAGYFLSRYDKSEQKHENMDAAGNSIEFLLESFLETVNNDYEKLIVKQLIFIGSLASEMFERFGENVFLAGGFYKNLFLQHTPKDLDFFFTDKESFQEAYNYFSTLTVPGSTTHLLKLNYENNNAVSYQMEEGIYSSVELIKKEFNDVETTLDRFDFTVTKAAFFRKNGKTFIMKHIDADKDITTRALRFENIETVKTENIIERIVRYQNYGFQIDYNSSVAALNKVSGMDLKSQKITADEVLSLWSKKRDERLKKNGAQARVESNLFYEFDSSPHNRGSEEVAYATNYDLTRAFRRFIKNLTYGIRDQDDLYGVEKIKFVLENEFQKLPEIAPLWVKKVSPSISILELLTACNKYGDINKTAEIMFFVLSPVSFVGRRKFPGTFFDCCERKSPYLTSQHTKTDGKLALVDGVESFVCKGGNYSFNRDESAEIVTILINKYGIDETIKMLNGIYSSVVAEKLPSYDIWISNIQDEIFTPDMDVNLFFDLVSEEIIDEEEVWRQQEAENAPF